MKKRLKTEFEIDIKPFTLKTAGADSPGSGEKKPEITDAVRNFSINNIKLSLFLLFGITMLLTVIIGYIPLKKQTESFSRKETLKTGILLTRYLAEMNRPFLESGHHTRVRTSPVRMEDGCDLCICDRPGTAELSHLRKNREILSTGTVFQKRLRAQN